jgi:predicted RNase H-like nuclease (RuvC/YqgF family)
MADKQNFEKDIDVPSKQIIIDGVNVAECEHLYREIDCLAHMDYSECCEGYDPSYGYCPNTDCYYKQLKRKEQECENYKQLAAKHCAETINMQREIDQLKAKNEKLKEEVKKQKEIAKEYEQRWLNSYGV